MTMQTQTSRAGRKADSGEELTTNERLVGNIVFLILGEVVFSLLACKTQPAVQPIADDDAPIAGFGMTPPRPEPRSRPRSEDDLHTESVLVEERDSNGVVVRSLLVGVTEVPVLFYQVCVGTGACSKTGKLRSCNFLSSQFFHPINCVSWSDADAYCRAHGERLPSEEEWDWIVGVEGGNPWGPSDDPCDFAVLQDAVEGRGCGANSTWPVQSKPRGVSRSGLRGLAGNVAEWTSTREGEGHVIRGGGWQTLHDEGGGVASRQVKPDGRGDIDVGFRCVTDIEDDAANAGTEER